MLIHVDTEPECCCRCERRSAKIKRGQRAVFCLMRYAKNRPAGNRPPEALSRSGFLPHAICKKPPGREPPAGSVIPERFFVSCDMQKTARCPRSIFALLPDKLYGNRPPEALSRSGFLSHAICKKPLAALAQFLHSFRTNFMLMPI